MSTHTRTVNGKPVKIHTSQPNPYGHEWSAVDDNYDASYEGPEDGYVSSSPRGWGKTEDAAIADLVEQIEDRAAQSAGHPPSSAKGPECGRLGTREDQ